MISVWVESADLSAESPGTEHGEAATESEIGIPHKKLSKCEWFDKKRERFRLYVVLLLSNFARSESAFYIYDM